MVVRAILAFHRHSDIRDQVSGILIDKHLRSPAASQMPALKPFWGPLTTEVDENLCFVVMPFSPAEANADTFKRYVRRPIERQLKMRCIRADDLLEPKQVRCLADVLGRK